MSHLSLVLYKLRGGCNFKLLTVSILLSFSGNVLFVCLCVCYY